jgi:hypothetical protein
MAIGAKLTVKATAPVATMALITAFFMFLPSVQDVGKIWQGS